MSRELLEAAEEELAEAASACEGEHEIDPSDRKKAKEQKKGATVRCKKCGKRLKLKGNGESIKDEAKVQEAAEVLEEAGAGSIRQGPGGRWQLRNRLGRWVDMNLPATANLAQAEARAKTLHADSPHSRGTVVSVGGFGLARVVKDPGMEKVRVEAMVSAPKGAKRREFDAPRAQVSRYNGPTDQAGSLRGLPEFGGLIDDVANLKDGESAITMGDHKITRRGDKFEVDGRLLDRQAAMNAVGPHQWRRGQRLGDEKADPGVGLTDADREALVARRVKGGGNEADSRKLLAELERGVSPGDNLAAALQYQGFTTPAMLRRIFGDEKADPGDLERKTVDLPNGKSRSILVAPAMGEAQREKVKMGLLPIPGAGSEWYRSEATLIATSIDQTRGTDPVTLQQAADHMEAMRRDNMLSRLGAQSLDALVKRGYRPQAWNASGDEKADLGDQVVRAVHKGENVYLTSDVDLNMREMTRISFEPVPMSPRAAERLVKRAERDETLSRVGMETHGDEKADVGVATVLTPSGRFPAPRAGTLNRPGPDERRKPPRSIESMRKYARETKARFPTVGPIGADGKAQRKLDPGSISKDEQLRSIAPGNHEREEWPGFFARAMKGETLSVDGLRAALAHAIDTDNAYAQSAIERALRETSGKPRGKVNLSNPNLPGAPHPEDVAARAAAARRGAKLPSPRERLRNERRAVNVASLRNLSTKALQEMALNNPDPEVRAAARRILQARRAT